MFSVIFPEKSSELAARDARYSAFESIVEEGDCLLLGQHADDQAETLLYRWLRGAGLHGASGMPQYRSLGGGLLFRPLLGLRREQIETIAEARVSLTAADQIADFVRQRLSYQFVSKLRDGTGRLPLVQIGPEWETRFSEHEIADPSGRKDIALPPDEFNRLADSVKSQLDNSATQGHFAAVATSANRRRFLKTVLSAKGIRNPVISYEEIMANERPAIVGVA